MIDFLILGDAFATQVRDLWEYCFQEGQAPDDWFFTHKYRPENVLGAVQDGEVLACLHMIPYTLRLRGAQVRGDYIVGVGVAPHARGLGLSTGLLRESLAAMRARGAVLSPLYPFDYAFYERKGWAICTRRLRVRLPMDGARREKRDDSITLVPLDRVSDAQLADAYAAFMQRYGGYIQRDAESFAVKRAEMAAYGQTGVAAMRGTRCVGYVLYANGKQVVSEELIYADARAAQALLLVLTGHASTAEILEFSVPEDSPLFHAPLDARGRAFLEPHAMMRIVDLTALAAALPLPTAEGYLRVSDALAPWNDGLFDLRTWTKVPSAPPRAPVAAVDITGLTQIVYGYITKETAIEQGLLTDSMELFSRMDFHTEPPYMIEVS